MLALAAAKLPDGTVLQTPGSGSCGPRQRNGTPPVPANPRVESAYTRPNCGGYYGDPVCVALSRQVRQIGPSDQFAADGPTGRLMPGLEVVVADLLGAPMIGRARVAAAMESARREPRLLVRMLAWMERNRSEVESLAQRRLGAGTPAYRLELIGIWSWPLPAPSSPVGRWPVVTASQGST